MNRELGSAVTDAKSTTRVCERDRETPRDVRTSACYKYRWLVIKHRHLPHRVQGCGVHVHSCSQAFKAKGNRLLYLQVLKPQIRPF